MSNDNVEENRNWVEEIQRVLEKIEATTEEAWIFVGHLTGKVVLEVNKRKEVEELMRKENLELKKQLTDQKFQLDEMEMERDVLLQQVHAYLEINSSLRIRLEEQRCQNGALKSQLNGDLERKIRMLERDKEKLMDMNVEKGKEVDRMRLMMEEARRKEKNEESDVKALKRDLERALEEKMKAEGRLREILKEQRRIGEGSWKIRKRDWGLKRSMSEGDMESERLEFLERNIVLEGPGDYISNCKLREVLKTDQTKESDAETKKKKFPEPPVHAQLDSLKRGLFNVTRKLECLKNHLIDSGAIKEELKESQRNLKRKAKMMEAEEGFEEEPKTGFKNLKSILEDAKTLNTKLENLRDEKQKIMTKKEKEVQVEIKMNDVSSQMTETGRHFGKTIFRLKEAMREYESELEKSSAVTEETFATFTSALVLFILSNFRCFSAGWLNASNERELCKEEGLNESKENGGGDNLLKIHEKPQNELKTQIARLKVKIELFENLGAR